MADDNQQKEKWARLREIILNIINEKDNKLPGKEKINKKEKLIKKNNLSNSPIKLFFKKIFFYLTKNKYNIWMVFIFLIIGFLIILGIGLYKHHWDNEQIIKITNVIPYPAIIIHNKETNSYKLIKYSEFQENFKAIKLFFQKQKQNDQNFQILSDQILKENTVKMMIEDYLIFDTLQKNKIVITKQETDNSIQKIINQVGSIEQLEKIIKNLYNWDLNQFKKKAIQQIISQEKIEKLISPKNLGEWLEEQFQKIKIYKFI
ncbi:MAG: hypothetical protein AAB732_00905 [Patescibacteria group bacterium]